MCVRKIPNLDKPKTKQGTLMEFHMLFLARPSWRAKLMDTYCFSGITLALLFTPIKDIP